MDVENIAYHSKNVGPGTLFVCIEGADFDGHTFAKEAVEKGSAVVLCSKPLSFRSDVTVVIVADTRKTMAELAAAFYHHPGRQLRLIGVTGTKGKTTVCHLIRDICLREGIACGLIGSIENDFGLGSCHSNQTTPESLDLQRMLANMVANGCKVAVIEVSSQALMQKRVWGIEFEIGIFTNLGEDHIGPKEHRDFEEYLYWKCQIFHQCKVAYINCDMLQFGRIMENIPAETEVETYGFEEHADLWVKDFEFVRLPGKFGMEFQTKGRYNIKLVVGAPGRFSIYNGLAAILAGKAMGCSDESIQNALREADIPGRQEVFALDENRMILVDYAHNGTALEALLSALRHYCPTRLTCVFGCGGNRDASRRWKMGEIAAKYADFSIITADNPRKESLDSIIHDIIKGMESFPKNYCVIRDRKAAIEYSIRHCCPGEIVVVAGKGHEREQLLLGEKIQFDDRAVVCASIEKVKYEQNHNRRNQTRVRRPTAFWK